MTHDVPTRPYGMTHEPPLTRQDPPYNRPEVPVNPPPPGAPSYQIRCDSKGWADIPDHWEWLKGHPKEECA